MRRKPQEVWLEPITHDDEIRKRRAVDALVASQLQTARALIYFFLPKVAVMNNTVKTGSRALQHWWVWITRASDGNCHATRIQRGDITASKFSGDPSFLPPRMFSRSSCIRQFLPAKASLPIALHLAAGESRQFTEICRAATP